MPTPEEIAQAAAKAAETNQQTPPASTDDASGDAAAQQQQANADEKRFTQADLDKAIKDRLERERKAAEEKQKAANDEAVKARLKEEGKLKELSEKQAADLLTLTTEKETLTAQLAERDEKIQQYEEVFTKQLAEQKKALPEPVQKLLEQMPVLEQSTWIAENAAKLGITVKGVPPTPKGNGGNGNSKDEEAAKQYTERRYNNF